MSLKIAVPATGLLLAVCLAAVTNPVAQPAKRAPASASSHNAPAYDESGKLLFPAQYREWVFLSSGVDMSYNPKAAAMDHSMFDNVFVNPESYATFVQTGAWPDKTVLVLESRMGMDKGSINQRGHFQGTDVMGLEVHVKDEARFPGSWAFFDFDNQVSGNLFPKGAACYTCHAEHAAVDTTFVQFYPTLLPVAQRKKTLSESYLKETAQAAQ